MAILWTRAVIEKYPLVVAIVHFFPPLNYGYVCRICFFFGFVGRTKIGQVEIIVII